MEKEKEASVKKPYSRFEIFLEKFTLICFIISGMMVVLQALVTTYGAARRYLFHSPDNNAYLFSSILMLGCVVFSIAHIQSEKKHITVDFVSQYLPKGLRLALLNIVGPLLGFIFCAVLTWKSWDNAWFALKSGEHTLTLLSIPTFPMQFSVPFATGLVSLVLLTQMVRNIISWQDSARELSKTGD